MKFIWQFPTYVTCLCCYSIIKLKNDIIRLIYINIINVIWEVVVEWNIFLGESHRMPLVLRLSSFFLSFFFLLLFVGRFSHLRARRQLIYINNEWNKFLLNNTLFKILNLKIFSTRNIFIEKRLFFRICSRIILTPCIQFRKRAIELI